jgi:hypothetical protein
VSKTKCSLIGGLGVKGFVLDNLALLLECGLMVTTLPDFQVM